MRPRRAATAVFWPAYAVMLAQNWVNRVTGPTALLPTPAATAPTSHRASAKLRPRHTTGRHKRAGRRHAVRRGHPRR